MGDAVIAQHLSARVDAAIKKVLGGETDDFDTPEFDAQEWVNRHFPDERSLEGLDRCISATEAEVKELDESVLDTVREQSTAGQLAARDIADAKDSIGDLHDKILEIKRKAVASEQMVQEICRDIRQLDVAKRHLTNTIMTLARLKTLASAVEQLSDHTRRRAYELAAPVLEAAIQLFTHFTDYRDVPKVAELAGAVERIREELRENINEDFDVLIECVTPDSVVENERRPAIVRLTEADLRRGGADAGDDEGRRAYQLTDDNVLTLQAACEVVDALGPAMRRSLIKAFCRKQLAPYGKVFRRDGEYGSSLDAVDKRYAWFNRALREVEKQYGRIFPSHWRVLHRMCIDFCEATRTDLDRVLGTFDPPHTAPAEPLLRLLSRTHAFEKEMAKRFEGENRGADGGAGGGAAARSGAGGGPDDDDGDGGVFDDSAPLYNAKGDLVDPATAEGIKLKYARRKEWEAERVRIAERRQVKQDKRAWWAGLAGVEAGGAAAGGSKADDDAASLPRIAEPGKGLISSACDPYMGAYVHYERQILETNLATAMAEDMSASQEVGASGSVVLRSSRQLFIDARNAVTRCAKLNAGQTLFSLYKEIQMAVDGYIDALARRLPQPAAPAPGAPTGAAKLYPVSEETAGTTVEAICMTISTADYCSEVLPQLSDNIRKAVEEAYKPHVTMEASCDGFLTLQASALNVLADVIASLLEAPLATLSRMAWASVTEVGDQSPYVAEVSRLLRVVMPRVRARLGEDAFRVLCVKFGHAFMPRYNAAIFRCKKIGELGAQQLLLDAQAIRTLLLAAPTLRGIGRSASDARDEEDIEAASTSLVDETAAPAPASYVSYVQREMPRAEMLLKLIATPRERFADTMKALWPDASAADLGRLMELKGLGKKEQGEVLAQLGHAQRGGGGAAAVASGLGDVGAGLTTGMREVGAKLGGVGGVGKLLGLGKKG